MILSLVRDLFATLPAAQGRDSRPPVVRRCSTLFAFKSGKVTICRNQGPVEGAHLEGGSLPARDDPSAREIMGGERMREELLNEA